MKIKKIEEFSINEAKSWPVDSIVKIPKKYNPDGTSGLGKNGTRAGKRRNRYGGSNDWGNWVPDQLPDVKNGLFYMKIKTSGKKWLEGPIIVSNCIANADFEQARAAASIAEPAGPEYSIFMKDKIFEKKLIGTSIFIDGKEDGLMDKNGDKQDVDEGEYIVEGFNFDLTIKLGKTVLYFIALNDSKNKFFATIESFENFTPELTHDQRSVIAEWFSSKLDDSDIKVKDGKFIIPKYKIETGKQNGYPAGFSAGPFISKKQAQDVLDSILELNTYSLFDPKNVEISKEWQTIEFELDALIKWAKSVGVTTTMKELLTIRKGAVVGRNYGV